VLLPVLFPSHRAMRKRSSTWAASRPGSRTTKYGEIPFGAKTMLIDGVEVPLLHIERKQISRRGILRSLPCHASNCSNGTSTRL